MTKAVVRKGGYDIHQTYGETCCPICRYWFDANKQNLTCPHDPHTKRFVNKRSQTKIQKEKIMEGSEVAITSELGSALVKEAQERQRKRLMDQTVGEVETVTLQIDQTEIKIKDLQDRLQTYRNRLAAIECGAITVARANNGNSLIVYKDEELRMEKLGY